MDVIKTTFNRKRCYHRWGTREEEMGWVGDACLRERKVSTVLYVRDGRVWYWLFVSITTLLPTHTHINKISHVHIDVPLFLPKIDTHRHLHKHTHAHYLSHTNTSTISLSHSHTQTKKDISYRGSRLGSRERKEGERELGLGGDRKVRERCEWVSGCVSVWVCVCCVV